MYTIETQFFPTQFFFALHLKGEVDIELHENYQKRSFRNRCMIAGANGGQLLTVPLKKGKNQQQPITEVSVSYDEDWPRIHLSSIEAAYRSAPYYDHYIEDLRSILTQKETQLYLLNQKIIQWSLRNLGEDGAIRYTSEFKREVEGEDCRGSCHPRNYERWLGIKYPQVFEDRFGFLPNLSIIDLLFCQGPYARIILKDFPISYGSELF